MGAEDNGLTLQGLAQRLEALEHENAALRDKLATLEGSDRGGLGFKEPSPESSEDPQEEGRVSRKWLLSKAGAVAAGLVVAGALTQTDIREAKAAQVIGDSAQEFRGGVEGSNTNSFGYGVMGRAPNAWGVDGQGGKAGVRGHSLTGHGVEGSNGSSARAGVYGENASTGPSVHGLNVNNGTGVLGQSQGGIGVKGVGKNGVLGESSTEGQNGVWGKHTNKGAGVSGEGRVGVIGFSHENGWNGVWGRHTANGRGVAGDSAQGVGVNGTSTSGIGGEFNGGKAQLMLVPKGTAGKPTTGSHTKGELYMDSKAALYVCVASGTPGRWRKVTTTKA